MTPLLGPTHLFPVASGRCPASSWWLLQEHSTMLCTASINRVKCTVVCDMHTQQFISHICYLAQLGRISLRVEVGYTYISDNRLLFSCYELMSGVASIEAVWDSVVLASQYCKRNVERLSSALAASRLSCSVSRTDKLDSVQDV